MNRTCTSRFLTLSAFLVVAVFILVPIYAPALPADGATPVNNREYVEAVHKLINNAESNIRVMLYQAFYYEEYPDSDSNVFIEELIAAKKRGVDVWVLMETSDWNPNLNDRNEDYAERLKKGGVKVYFDEKNITSHQKVMIVDDYATVVASNNWSHFSLWLNNEAGVILWSEPVAEAYSEYMNERMEKAGHDPLPETSAKKHVTPEKLDFRTYKVKDVLLLNNRDYFPETMKLMEESDEAVRVIQRATNYYYTRPSFADDKSHKPGDPVSQTNTLLKGLIAADLRAVDVKVMLDAEVRKRRSTGEWIASDENQDYAMRLLAGGVPVYYDSLTTQTHAKMLIIDDHVIVGSTNWSLPALEIGNEASVAVESEELADYYMDFFDDLREQGIKVKPGFDLQLLRRQKEAADMESAKSGSR